MIDYCLGFGSVVKYIVIFVMEIVRDVVVYLINIVIIIEVMGRNVGWFVVVFVLVFKDIGVLDLIYFFEVLFLIDKFLDDVRNIYKKIGKIIIVVLEGIKDKEGKYIVDMSYKFGIDVFGYV